MKLKYYLRGLGIGILVTTIIMMIASPKKDVSLSDDEIIARAAQLGMVMKEDTVSEPTDDKAADDALPGKTGDGAPNDARAASTEGTPDETPAGNADQNDDSGTNANPAGNPAGGNPDAGAENKTPDGGGDHPEDGGEAQGAENGTPDGSDPSASQNNSYRLVIERGDVCRTVCERLAANNVITDAEAMRTYLFEIGYASSMSTGEYEIPYGLSMEQVADILRSGPIKY